VKLQLRQMTRSVKVNKFPSAAELLRHSLDTFLAKDMKGWSLLCADDEWQCL
jgi:hypothetical protein